MSERLDLLRPLARSVQKYFHGITIGMHPYGDWLTIALVPVPVRKQVQYGLRSPPRLVVIEVIFGEAAHVDDAELRVNRRPSIGRGLAAIVEASPGEAAGEPFARRIELPPLFGQLRPVRMIQVIGADPIAQFVGGIDSAGADCAGGFAAHARGLRMRLVPAVVNLQVVVEAHDVELFGKMSLEGSVYRGRTKTRRIEFVRARDHVVDDTHALRLRHHDTFFIAHGPQNDRW